jgi:hypothetical protein
VKSSRLSLPRRAAFRRGFIGVSYEVSSPHERE